MLLSPRVKVAGLSRVWRTPSGVTTMENRSASTLGAILIVFTAIFIAHCAEGLQSIRPQHDKVVVCYVSSWATYRPERGSFSIVPELHPEHCTHLVYAFAGLNASTSSLRSLDAWADLEEGGARAGYRNITGLRNRYPGLKVTIAIGGWNEGSENYSALAAKPELRRTFVHNAVDFVSKHKFDGLDLDWEFPGQRGGAPQDKQNFVSLVKELSEAFKRRGLMLTAALGAGISTIDTAYDIAELSKYLDFIHIMAYDYHGTWDGKVLANAPLHHAPDKLSVEDSVRYMILLGAPRRKLVLGLPTYGRTFFLTNPPVSTHVSPINRGAEARGFPGPYTKEDGFMGYNEICAMLVKDPEWRRGWDEASSTPWAIKWNQTISYDDPRSLMMKADFASEMKLAGVMVWSIDTDDFHGDCAVLNEEILEPLLGLDYPLMRSINMALARAPSSHGESNDVTPKTPEPNSSPVLTSLSESLIVLTVLLSYFY